MLYIFERVHSEEIAITTFRKSFFTSLKKLLFLPFLLLHLMYNQCSNYGTNKTTNKTNKTNKVDYTDCR